MRNDNHSNTTLLGWYNIYIDTHLYGGHTHRKVHQSAVPLEGPFVSVSRQNYLNVPSTFNSNQEGLHALYFLVTAARACKLAISPSML